jgi:hypothetical protein
MVGIRVLQWLHSHLKNHPMVCGGRGKNALADARKKAIASFGLLNWKDQNSAF